MNQNTTELHALLAAVRYANEADRLRFKKAISTRAPDTASIHQRLAVTVPAARHLNVYLTQIRTGQPTRTFEDAPAKLVALFWYKFVRGTMPLPEGHELLKAPLSTDLVRIFSRRELTCHAEADRMGVECATLGELVVAYEAGVRREQAANHKRLQAEQLAVRKVAARVKSMLSGEEYRLLCKYPHALAQAM